MQIFLSAGIHDNPVHRRRLKIWLKSLGEKQGAPKFIAVEANRTLFQVVLRRQRDEFVRLSKQDEILGKINKVFLKKLSLSIAYEADGMCQ